MQSSQASTLPQTNMCFCGKTTQSQDLYVASRSGLHWPCSPSQIIEPRPHSAGRNLEIAFACASEPPGQLMKAQIPGLQSQDSDSVGLGWPCFSSKLPKHVSAADPGTPCEQHWAMVTLR